MGSLNKVQIIGNLGRDAELKYTQGGTAMAKFSVATTETWNDKSGQRQERTEWHNVTLWGKSAEATAEYLRKGKQVYVEGRLQSNSYEDRDGVKRKVWEVRADRLVLLGGGPAGGSGRRTQAAADGLEPDAPAQPEPAEAGISDDDVPF